MFISFVKPAVLRANCGATLHSLQSMLSVSAATSHLTSVAWLSRAVQTKCAVGSAAVGYSAESFTGRLRSSTRLRSLSTHTPSPQATQRRGLSNACEAAAFPLDSDPYRGLPGLQIRTLVCDVRIPKSGYEQMQE